MESRRCVSSSVCAAARSGSRLVTPPSAKTGERERGERVKKWREGEEESTVVRRRSVRLLSVAGD